MAELILKVRGPERRAAEHMSFILEQGCDSLPVGVKCVPLLTPIVPGLGSQNVPFVDRQRGRKQPTAALPVRSGTLSLISGYSGPAQVGGRNRNWERRI